MNVLLWKIMPGTSPARFSKIKDFKDEGGGGEETLITISAWLSHNLNYFSFIVSMSGRANLSFLFLIFRSVLAILEDSLLFHDLFRINLSGFTKNSVGLWSHIKSQGHIKWPWGWRGCKFFSTTSKSQTKYHGTSWQIVNSDCLAEIFLSWNNVLRLRTSGVFLITSWS